MALLLVRRRTAAKIRLSACYISRGGAAECRARSASTGRRGIAVRDDGVRASREFRDHRAWQIFTVY
jgi:hypothetical protein